MALIVLILLSCSFNIVTASQSCYQCDEGSDANCGTPFVSSGIATTLCSGPCYSLLNEGGQIERGCSVSCQNGTEHHCCTTSLCNSGGFNTCHKCDEAQESNCGDPFNPAGISKVNCSTLFQCYTEERSTGIVRGCATACTTGARTDCCTGQNCNTATPEPLKCHSCKEEENEGCGQRFDSTIATVTCDVPNSCYTIVKNRWIERGCGAFNTYCVTGGDVTETSCCSDDKCNGKSHAGENTFSCYYCHSKEDADCGDPFLASGVPKVECDPGSYCYKDSRGVGIERGCAGVCSSNHEGLKCCTTHECNAATIPTTTKWIVVTSCMTVYLVLYMFLGLE